jgi:hypothetical protein
VPCDGSKEHNDEMDQIDEVCHRFQGRRNDYEPQGHRTRDNLVGSSNDEPTVA